jgi:PKD repeat protein
MKKVLLIGLGLILMIIMMGCAKSAVTTSHESGLSAPGATSGRGVTYTSAPMTTTAAATKSYSVPPATVNTSVPLPSQVDRMVIRTGDIQMIVNQISVSLDSVTEIAARYGGYVISSQQWKEGDRNIGSISIRVLAENYVKAMADIRSLAKSVTTESTNSQDVTEEYTDLNSQIKNLEATETQLLKIMEGATKTEDILSIQRELTTVRGQIEQIKGRMLYLERTTSTSFINVRMEEAVLALKFNAAKISSGTNETVSFTCEVIGGFAPYNYYWDFGDGNTSVEQSPGHAYKEAGSYTVGLKVTDDKGYTNTLIRESYINVVNSWKPGSVAHNAWNGLTVFGKGLINFLIWIGIFSFVWIPIGAVVWYFAFFRHRKKHLK